MIKKRQQEGELFKYSPSYGEKVRQIQIAFENPLVANVIEKAKLRKEKRDEEEQGYKEPWFYKYFKENKDD